MDRQLRKILTESIRDIETGDLDVEGCLQRHPDRAAELRPHLELWRGLNSAPKAQPNFGGQQRGLNRLLGALSDTEKTSRGSGRMIPAFAKAAAVAVTAVLLVGGAVGTSAAFGGPDVAGDVLSGIGITSNHGGGPAEGTLETARDNADEKAQPGLDTAERGSDNRDGSPPAAENGLNTAAEAQGQAGVGADASNGHADQGLDTAEGAGADNKP